MTYSTVFFDVDGTLVHSSPGIIHSMEHTFSTLGLDPSQIDLHRYIGPPLRWAFGRHFSSEADIERAIEIYRAYYHEVGQFECKAYPGVIEMLKTLRESGVFLCTATSKPIPVAMPILEREGLAELFDIIGGASLDKSVDTKTDVIRQLLADERLQGRTPLMVGDRGEDMRGADECGLAKCGVLYGYGSREELEPYHPVYLVNTVEELTKTILER